MNKLVCENLQEFLNETYQSYEELKALVKDIVLAFKNKNLNRGEIHLLKDIVDMKKYKDVGIIANIGIKSVGPGINGEWGNPDLMRKNKKYKSIIIYNSA